MALGNITLRSTSSSSVVNLKANVDASIDIVNRPLTHEEVDLNFLEIGASVKANLISNFTTSDLTEGTNLYYTTARVGTYLSGTAKLGDLSDVTAPTASDDKYHMYYDHSSTSIKFGNFSSTNYLPEGSTNLYFTNARADARIAAATTDNLSEGSTNKYYTDARWDTRLGTKTTANLTEGSNLYFTNARADARADARIAASSINALSDVDTTGIATNKILKWTGTNWTIADLTTSTLSGLTDTTISGASNGQVLKYNGSAWVNSTDLNNTFDADFKANVITSSTSDVKASPIANKNVILDLNANASIVGNSATAVGDVISSAYLNTTTNIATAVNMSDLIIEGDLLSGVTLKTNSNNANVTNVGANLSAYHYNKTGEPGFNISLFDDAHSVHDSYIKAKANGFQWQFKVNDDTAGSSGDTRQTIFAGDTRGTITYESRAYDNLRRYTAKTVSGVTQANPGVVTATGHSFENGETVVFAGVVGMTQLNGNSYEVANKTANTFELKGTNTTGFTAYASGGAVTLNDAEAYGPVNANYKAQDLTLTATNDLKLKPTGKLDVGSTPGHWNATTQARIQKSQSYFATTGLDNTQRHYNEAHGNKLTFGANVDANNRKQGVLNDTIFDLNGFTFGADNPTNLYKMLGGAYDWASLHNTGGSAKTVSGLTSRHIGAEIYGGARNLTVTNLAGVTALANLDDATSSVTNLAAIVAHTGNDNGTATNRYSIYAPEANDTAYFAGTVKANKTVHGVQNISGPGAISLTETVSLLTTTGTDAYTLADGTEGQIKVISMKVNGGNGTVTPTNFVNGTSILFNDVQDTVTLLYQTTGWVLLARQNATVI